MADRQLKVTLVGDSRQLERTLGRAETRLQKFGRTAGGVASVGGVGGGVGGVLGLTRGTAITAAAGATVLAIKNVTDAAERSQVILGQTSVAVTDAGLSWAKYGEQVQAAALSISSSSAFDDEAVLQSFQVFIRGQKDVAKSLELSKLSADVARGRYIDLATATQLVNKAANGQIGALRRAGIFIDKNATSTQALTALQSAYGGAAVRYANSAAGAQDKLGVSVENLRESLGSKLLPALTKIVTGLNDAAVAGGHLHDTFQEADKQSHGFMSGALVNIGKFAYEVSPAGQLQAGVKAINSALADTKNLTADIATNAAAFSAQFGLGALTGSGPSRIDPGGKNQVAANGPTTGVSPSLHNQELDARLGGNRNTLKGVLAKEAQFLQNELKSTLPEDQAPLKEALLGVTEEIKAIDAAIISDANDKRQAAKDAAEKIKANKQKAIDALKAQAQAFKDQADAIKSAVLDAFDTKTSKINNARALEDAKKTLRQARQLGGAGSIETAQRGVQDAQRAIQRQRIEDTTFRVTGGPAGPVNRVQVGTIIFNISGTDDADKVAAVVLKKLQVSNRHGSPQGRGRAPGAWTGLH